MRYNEDESKGDLAIVPKGAVNLAVKETVNIRRIEFLNATNLMKLILNYFKDGRAAILREVAKGLQMPVDDIIPSKEKEAFQARLLKAQQEKQQAQQPQQGQVVDPAGNPAGGMAANTVQNRSTGASQ